MKYDVRIDGHTIETFDTFEGANAQAEKLNGALSLTAPDKKAIVVGDYGKVGEQLCARLSLERGDK